MVRLAVLHENVSYTFIYKYCKTNKSIIKLESLLCRQVQKIYLYNWLTNSTQISTNYTTCIQLVYMCY